MKKSAFLMALAIAAGMASCAQGPKANMKNEVDTWLWLLLQAWHHAHKVRKPT